jgi:Zinc knuckle
MFDYCSDFREVEAQIYNMMFIDRLERFTLSFAPECKMYIYNIPRLHELGDMEVAYNAARDWATNYTLAYGRDSSSSHSGRRHAKKGVRFAPMATLLPATAKEKEREEDTLDMMDVSEMECYNCHRIGHLAQDCKQPKKSRVSRQEKGRFSSQTLFVLEFDCESSSEEEEEEEPSTLSYDREYIDESDLHNVDYDYLNFMSYEVGDADDADYSDVLSYYEGEGKEGKEEDWDTDNYLNLLSVYEMEDSAREKAEVGHITVISVPLPQYHIGINGWDEKAIIDSGAST